MSKKIEFLSFWAINDTLNIEKIKKQLYEMKRLGLDGVVFQPHYIDESYMSLLSEIILYAKNLDISFTICHDKSLIKGFKKSKSVYLELVSTLEVKDTDIVIQSNSIGNKHVVKREMATFNPLDKKSTKLYLKHAFEDYKNSLSSEAFEYISGFFIGDISFLDYDFGIAYCDELDELLNSEFGDDLKDLYISLFVNEEKNELESFFRVFYLETLNKILSYNFYKPINKWCEKNNKSFMSYLKDQENIYFQVLKNIKLPAINSIENLKYNNYFASIAKSISNQFSNGDTLAIVSSDCVVTPENFSDYMLWLISHGFKKIVIYINQYELNAKAVLKYPKSIPFNISWKEAFPSVLQSIHEKSTQVLDKHDELVLVVAPIRGIMSEFIQKSTTQKNEYNLLNIKSTNIRNNFYKLVSDISDYDMAIEYTDEHTFEQFAKIKDGFLFIGNQKYKKIILPMYCLFYDKGQQLFETLKKNKIKIYNYENWFNYFNLKKYKTEIPVSLKKVNIFSNKWEIDIPSYNILPVEFSYFDNNKMISEIIIDISCLYHDFRLIFSDPVSEVLVNSVALLETKKDVIEYKIPDDLINNTEKLNIKIFTNNCTQKKPLVFLTGPFLLKSDSDYCEFSSKQVNTKGPFRLCNFISNDIIKTTEIDFIKKGFPFNIKPIILRKIFTFDNDLLNLNPSFVYLKFDIIICDAFRLFINGKDYGYFFGDFECKISNFDFELENIIEIQLIPSTFNLYDYRKHVNENFDLEPVDRFTDDFNFIKVQISDEIDFYIN